MADSKSFKKTFRGFDPEEVQRYISSQAEERQASEEQLRKEIRLQNKVIAEMKLRLSRREEELDKTKAEIEKRYKSYVTNYEKIGELVYESRVRADEVLADAREAADRLVQESQERANRIVREAEERAQRITSEAKENARQLTERAEEAVSERLAEGTRKYQRVQGEMNEIVDIINEAQRSFIKTYKEIHEIVQQVPNRLTPSDIIDGLDEEKDDRYEDPDELEEDDPDSGEDDGQDDEDWDDDSIDENYDLFVHSITKTDKDRKSFGN